jgi:g-D-glutamyl-meso-diaminopimelate peptidase
VEILGQSEEGRDIPVLRLGAPEAAHHVLLHGAIHGREYITTWLLMALVDHQLAQGLPENVCFHIIPMVNPDGVHISQTGTMGDAQQGIYQRDKANKYTSLTQGKYATLWKANALGIDLNRSFPAGWESLKGHKEPSSERYKGTQPFDAVEARLLRDYTLAHSFGATVSFHSTGSVIYYDYGRKQPVNQLSKSFAKAVRELTGFRLEGQSSVDGAGYKDWAIEELGIPSLTLELGCLDAPIVRRELESVFARCYDLLPTIARWVTAQ